MAKRAKRIVVKRRPIAVSIAASKKGWRTRRKMQKANENNGLVHRG
jgi:hypothetical protein